MDDFFKIYVHRLEIGQQEKIDGNISPEFLDVQESDLVFRKPVVIRGEATRADDSLLLHLSISTEVLMPCAVCNEDVAIPLEISDFYHDESIDEITSGIFDFRELVREMLLLEVPHVAECHGGACPERKDLEKYFSNKGKEDLQHPFSDL